MATFNISKSNSINSRNKSGSSQLIRAMEIDKTAKDAEKMHKLQAAKASCLTCNNTKIACGTRLVCSAKKGKLVNTYNLCPEWHGIKVSREAKEKAHLFPEHKTQKEGE